MRCWPYMLHLSNPTPGKCTSTYCVIPNMGQRAKTFVHSGEWWVYSCVRLAYRRDPSWKSPLVQKLVQPILKWLIKSVPRRPLDESGFKKLKAALPQSDNSETRAPQWKRWPCSRRPVKDWFNTMLPPKGRPDRLSLLILGNKRGGPSFIGRANRRKREETEDCKNPSSWERRSEWQQSRRPFPPYHSPPSPPSPPSFSARTRELGTNLGLPLRR